MRSFLATIALASIGFAPWKLALATEDGDKFLQVLLRPAGWSAEWSGPGGSGRTDVTFVRQGNGFLAKIQLIAPLEMTCENTALVESNNVTFDGCRDPQVRLTFDANDRAVPLRGRSPRGYEWTVRPK
jgi:hypothetical protein